MTNLYQNLTALLNREQRGIAKIRAIWAAGRGRRKRKAAGISF